MTGETQMIDHDGDVIEAFARTSDLDAPHQVSKKAAKLRFCLNESAEANTNTLIAGHELGTALIEARDQLSQGSFDIILEQSSLDRHKALNLIRFAESCTIEQIQDGQSAVMRQGMLQLGCVPIGERTSSSEGTQLAVTKSINSFLNPWHAFMTGVKKGKVIEDKQAIRQATSELYFYLRGIHEGVTG